MAQVKIDKIEGSSLRRTAEGSEAQRIARVSGLSGGASDRLRAACDAPGIPSVGEPHPTIANLYVCSLVAVPDGAAAAIVTISYRSRSAEIGETPVIQVGSSVVQTTTETDADGNRITVSYSASGDDVDLKTQGSRVSVLVPQTTLRFTRTEDASPLAKARTCVGTINKTEVFDSASGTWLCTAIAGRSLDGGATYEVTYEFQYNGRGWQPTVSYIDPQTNRPPPELTDGLGAKTVNVYLETEFKELGL